MNKLLTQKEYAPEFEKEMEKISPFELKNRLIELADESIRKMMRTLLNAGRGNPNWVATVPREAFFLLGDFALKECRSNGEFPEGLAGLPQKRGIAERFRQFIENKQKEQGAGFLQKCFNYMIEEHKVDADELGHEWAVGVIGYQ